MSHITITETDPRKDWSYLSEGGATIVFTYVGSSHPLFSGKVLRLRKCSLGRLLDVSSIENEEPDDPSIVFQQRVTSQLIPQEYLPQLQTVKLEGTWLQELKDVTNPQRPSERAIRDVIDITKKKGVLATDLVGGNGWAVEIKPKWGFLPSSKYLSHFTMPLKTNYCRYCMHSHLKGAMFAGELSRYCPLDLYSGDEARVRTALAGLWHMWIKSGGKANNLRFFNEGQVVNPTDEHSLIALSHKVCGVDRAFSQDALCSSFIEAILPLILNKRLLTTLGSLQRSLDSFDIEGLQKLWSNRYPDLHLGEKQTDPTLEEWEHFIRRFLTGGTDEMRYYLLSYVLSATFKDCSVILRLGTGKNSISVIDLDPKSLNRLPKWLALDQDIVRNFAEVATHYTPCTDTNNCSSP